MNCNICPRKCNADRKNVLGYCNSTYDMRIARADLHMWEEDCISGTEGSGTIFFTGCNLRCIFCQNHEISGNSLKGAAVSPDRLASIMLELEEKKANNINLVTGAHFLPQIIKAIYIAKDSGLTIPIVYNSSGYESVGAIKGLDGLVDVYLPDFKYYDNELAKKFSGAGDYFETASAAVDEMVRQCGKEEFNERGIMTRGVIIRHLCLPGHTKDSKRVIQYLHDRYGEDVYISIMSQYTPVRTIEDYPELNRTLTKREYAKVVDYAVNECGIEKGFMQEGKAAKESFIPVFDFKG